MYLVQFYNNNNKYIYKGCQPTQGRNYQPQDTDGYVERGGGESERLWTCPECDDDDTDHKPLRSVKKHASQSLLAMAPNNKDNVFYTSHIGRGGRLSLLAS